MNTKELTQILSHMEIIFDSISFYQQLDGDECVPSPDTEFGECDLTHESGTLVNCVALNHDGDLVEFQALESLVGGELGHIAGAF